MNLKVYRSGIHRGEEPVIIGNSLSGMVNFSGCHLRCSFCYTPETSVHAVGLELTSRKFYRLLDGLLERGAENINLISVTHVWSKIEKSLTQLRNRFDIPIIAKISGFESARLIKRMSPLVDVFVPDFKVSSELAAVHFNLPQRYGAIALRALQTMALTHGELRRTSDGLVGHGVVLRHLMIPNFTNESVRVIHALGRTEFRGYFNLMTNFIDVEQRRIVAADDREVTALADLARSRGLNLLVNGKPPQEEIRVH